MSRVLTGLGAVASLFPNPTFEIDPAPAVFDVPIPGNAPGNCPESGAWMMCAMFWK